uniref:Ferric-chelate reductase n=2 Tax=Ganoderma boninense TaxID=34458 RepID=A0A5K1JZ90_9APHY|nr:Ferric-chelate reductase [Ganoderma boninense]
MRFSVAAAVFALSAATSGYAKVQMSKSGGDATYYTPGLGSCGHNNVATDFIVAVDHATITSFPGAGANPNTNPMCGRKMRVTYGKKSVTVTVADTCPGCAVGSVDLTPTAFEKLAPLSVGRLHGVKWTLL